MGTFVLTNFTNIQKQGDWDLSGLSVDTLNFNVDGQTYGYMQVQLDLLNAQLFLDGGVTPVSYNDLPDDFGIEEIDMWGLTPWITTNQFAPIAMNFPLTHDNGSANVFGGGSAQLSWDIQPIGLYNYQINGLSTSRLTLADPYLGVGYPPVLTKWNGFLAALLSQGQFRISFNRTNIADPVYELYVLMAKNNVLLWEMRGTYDSYPPPPNPLIYPTGGIDFGGAPTIQALTDASGIYTLVPGQYHDELYQRVGANPATSINVPIPEPFFKTGFIGGN
jgi:hypothetical protein